MSCRLGRVSSKKADCTDGFLLAQRTSRSEDRRPTHTGKDNSPTDHGTRPFVTCRYAQFFISLLTWISWPPRSFEPNDHRLFVRQAFNAHVAKARLLQPADTIGTGKVEAAICHDQHVEA